MLQTLKDIKKAIQDKQLKPVYCLHGEEPYYMDILVEQFEQKILSEGEKSFNFTTFYGKEATAKMVIDTASRYPMMAPYQLIIIKEAQEFKELKKLESYFNKLVPTTILLIVHKYKKIDLRTSFGKLLKNSKDISLMESKKLYDNQVPKWIEDYIKSKGYTLEVGVSDLLAETLGTDLVLITNELGKLFYNVKKGHKVTAPMIEKYIGISKEYNVFELTDAFSIRDTEKVFKIYNNFSANIKKHPLVMTISTLFSYFSKVYMLFFVKTRDEIEAATLLGMKPRNPMSAAFQMKRYKQGIRNYSKSQVEEIIAILKEFDLKSKGLGSIGVPEDQLMKELFAKILL